MIKKVHHIGIAVNNLKESTALFEKLLGTKAHIEEAPCQKVIEAVFKIGEGVEIDLVEPMGPDSAVAKFLEKRGEGLHHIALEVDDINAELKAMEEKGIQLIDQEGRKGWPGRSASCIPNQSTACLLNSFNPEKRENNNR